MVPLSAVFSLPSRSRKGPGEGGRRPCHARAILLGSLLATAPALLVTACDDADPAPRPAQTDPEERPADPSARPPTPPDPSSDDPPRADAPAQTATDLPENPASGCRIGDAVSIWPRPAWVDLAAAEDAFLVAGTAPSGTTEDAFVVRVEPGGAPRQLARATLEHAVPAAHRRAAPALVVRGGRAAFAVVDADRRLLLATFDVATPALTLAPFADGASLRFAPALAARDAGWAVAWTDDRETPMRVRGALAGSDGQRPDLPRDLTAAGGGGAAPAFVDGAPDTLVFVDPRQGMSVAHRVSLGDGFGATEVARPVSLLAEPPEIAAVRVGDARWLAYTATGSLATTAVGLVRLDGTAPPAPLVPGTGYGVLHVDGARLGDGAVFVADAPTASAPDSPRVVRVRVVGADGVPSEPVSVAGPRESAARGRVAVAGSAVGITFTDADGTYVAIGRCASP